MIRTSRTNAVFRKTRVVTAQVTNTQRQSNGEKAAFSLYDVNGFELLDRNDYGLLVNS